VLAQSLVHLNLIIGNSKGNGPYVLFISALVYFNLWRFDSCRVCGAFAFPPMTLLYYRTLRFFSDLFKLFVLMCPELRQVIVEFTSYYVDQ